MAKGIPPYDQSEVQLARFIAAVMAFEVRFDRDLAANWENHEIQTHSSIVSAPLMEKYRFFQDFFKNVRGEVALVIHKYYPSLLQIAAANREHLDGQSPFDWTRSQMLTRVCNSLGLDEVFDPVEVLGPASVPRTDSRVLASAERLATGKGWLDDHEFDTFVLPVWTKVPHPVEALWSLQPPEARARHEAEIESAKLSRAETLEWAKHEEFLIRKKIERQMDDEMRDGVMEAGKSGISVLDPVKELAGAPLTQQPERKEDPKALKLGPKKIDMSRYLDSVKLTDRQHECASLRFEYGLTVAQIARHFCCHHSTVQETIAAINRKFRESKGKERRDKNLARSSLAD